MLQITLDLFSKFQTALSSSQAMSPSGDDCKVICIWECRILGCWKGSDWWPHSVAKWSLIQAKSPWFGNCTSLSCCVYPAAKRLIANLIQIHSSVRVVRLPKDSHHSIHFSYLTLLAVSLASLAASLRRARLPGVLCLREKILHMFTLWLSFISSVQYQASWCHLGHDRALGMVGEVA